jgi:hypothetical protein
MDAIGLSMKPTFPLLIGRWGSANGIFDTLEVETFAPQVRAFSIRPEFRYTRNQTIVKNGFLSIRPIRYPA